MIITRCPQALFMNRCCLFVTRFKSCLNELKIVHGFNTLYQSWKRLSGNFFKKQSEKRVREVSRVFSSPG